MCKDYIGYNGSEKGKNFSCLNAALYLARFSGLSSTQKSIYSSHVIPLCQALEERFGMLIKRHCGHVYTAPLCGLAVKKLPISLAECAHKESTAKCNIRKPALNM